MLKSYKYRIYPTKEQEEQINKTFGCSRFVYNKTLAYRKEKYEKEKVSVSKIDCNNYCNRELKKEYEWLKEVDKFALTNALKKEEDIQILRVSIIIINHIQQITQMEI